MKNQAYLNQYFGNEWNSNIEKYKYSGPALATKVTDDEWVLDVGCGDNYFKDKIKNLVGIDPANNKADIIATIEEFTFPHLFDVAFCLGSINFGDYAHIDDAIAQTVALLKPKARMYWRCNPGQQDHKTDGCKKIDFFPWSEELLQHFANRYSFTMPFVAMDTGNRIYAEWVRG